MSKSALGARSKADQFNELVMTTQSYTAEGVKSAELSQGREG